MRHPTLAVLPAIPLQLLLNTVYPLDVLVGLLVLLFHVFLTVRFPNLIQMSLTTLPSFSLIVYDRGPVLD